MKEDAVQIHDGKSNVIYHYKCRRGDVDKAFEEADVVVENTYYSPFVDHVFLQLESGLSYMEEGRLVLVASSQYPHFDRLEIAEALGWKKRMSYSEIRQLAGPLAVEKISPCKSTWGLPLLKRVVQ